jgi:PspA associated protein B
MGLLDVLRGRRELKRPAPDRLFALTTAYVTIETALGMRTRGVAGIVFQPLNTSDFRSIVTEMEEVVRATSSEAAGRLETSDDSFGYRWMILRDPDFEDLVVGVNAVSSALEAGGYGERVLCAVFPFEEAGGEPRYWIYNYKRGYFYPFVPSPGDQQRDNERELRLKAQIGAELPVEPELERWFPLWDIPI